MGISIASCRYPHIPTLTLMSRSVSLRWQSPPGRSRYASVSQNAMSSRTRSRQSSSNVPTSFIALVSSILISSDRRLAQQTKLLKERNASLLKAVGSVRANPSSSTVYIPGTASGEEYVVPRSHSSLSHSFIRVGTLSAQLIWRPSNPRYLPSGTSLRQCTRHKARTPNAFSR